MNNVVQLDCRRLPKTPKDPLDELKERVSLHLTPDFTTLKSRGLNPVFVYGTLKKSFSNHFLLEQEAYLGEAVSVASNFVLRDGKSFPYMSTTPYGAKESGRVSGEVYAVDAFTMARLDRLEGNGSFYTREKRFFTLKDQEVLGKSGEIFRPTLECWVYLVPYEDYSHVDLCRYSSKKNQVTGKNVKVFFWG